ncbi:MAG: hypothetical protein AAGI07_00290 [Bacteroidota bacterium]
MSLLSIEYYNEGQTTKSIEIDATAKDLMIINFANKNMEVRCTEIVTVAGTSVMNSQQFIMRVNNMMQVPVIDQQGQPVMRVNPDFDNGQPESEDNPAQIQKTIGEFDMWIAVFFNNVPTINVRVSLAQAIKRKLVDMYDATFDPAPQPLVFVEA